MHEPPYEGLNTVLFSIRYPDMTAHLATDRCPLEYPHEISVCGEWNESRVFLGEVNLQKVTRKQGKAYPVNHLSGRSKHGSPVVITRTTLCQIHLQGRGGLWQRRMNSAAIIADLAAGA